MGDYFAFGGCLRSELEFPDLSPCPDSIPDRVVVVSDELDEEPGVLQGEREVEPGWTLRLHRLRSGWRLEYESTGSYAILDGGRRIALDGDVPVNPHGGQLSEGRTHGFGFLYEAVAQLRGDAGERQVADAKTAVVTSGGGTPSGVLLLQRFGV